MPTPDAQSLEKLRRGFPLRMDGLGRFFLDGDAVTHPRIVALLRSGLDASATGEPIVRVHEQWTYLEVADCALRVTRVIADANDAPAIVLDDGRTLALDAPTLWEEPDRGLRCIAPSQPSGLPLSARFSNTAQMDIQPWIRWPDESHRPRLVTPLADLLIPELPATPEKS